MKSYSAGSAVSLCEEPIGKVFDGVASRNRHKEALVSRHQGLRLTYDELQYEVDSTAAGLWGMGIRPGDRVGMWATSCAEWVYLQIATARIGAILVNVNPAYRAHDLAYIIERSEMKALFLHERDARANYREIMDQACRQSSHALWHSVLLGTGGWEDMIQAGTTPDPVSVSNDDVVNIQYTSGTTGSPKGVLLTHRNLLNNAILVSRCLRWTPEDNNAPLCHVPGKKILA